MIMVDEKKYKIKTEGYPNQSGKICQLVSIIGQNGVTIFGCWNPVDLIQIAFYNPFISNDVSSTFIAVTLDPDTNTFGFQSDGFQAEGGLLLPRSIDNRIWLFQSAYNQPWMKLYDAFTHTEISIPTFSGCIYGEVGLKKSSYSNGEVSCIELTVPVQRSTISDQLTYIFQMESSKESMEMDKKPSIRFVGVHSDRLSHLLETSYKAQCRADSFRSLNDLMEEHYFPFIEEADIKLACQQELEKNQFFEKRFGSKL